MALKKVKAIKAKVEKSKPEKIAPTTAGAGPSQQECSTRYKAAKSAGTLGALTWNEFRSAGCPTTMAKRSGSMLPTMGSLFPSGVAQKHAREPEAGITEPRWTEDGGGYYSECNKRLSQQ